MNAFNREWGTLVKAHRTKLGWGLERFAKVVHCNSRILQRIEEDGMVPEREMLIKAIVERLKIPKDEAQRTIGVARAKYRQFLRNTIMATNEPSPAVRRIMEIVDARTAVL